MRADSAVTDLHVNSNGRLQTGANYAAAPVAPACKSPRVSVVIVAWNAQRFVLECLETLSRYCTRVVSEVIIVDNASTDGTPDQVAERFPEFVLIRNAYNYGFSKANNIGIARCTGDYICLVNSDVSFTYDCISPMLQYLAEHPAVAMLGPQMLDGSCRVRRSTMRFPTLWNSFCRALGLDRIFRRSRFFGGMLMADFDHCHTRQVEVLNGWFLMVRRSAIEKVGLLDMRFFIYGEDVDWCYRFRQAGYKIEFFAEAFAIHYGGCSSASAPIRFSLEMHRANLQYWEKHHGWVARKLFLVSVALLHAARLVGYGLLCFSTSEKRRRASSGVAKSMAGLRWAGDALVGGRNAGSMQPSPTR